MTEPKTPYRIEEGADLEQQRLGELAAVFDSGSTRVLERFVAPGHRCLEVGTGGGSIARWLAAQVGPSGAVVATDIDLQFVGEPPANVEVLRHDITTDELPADSFDLAHARGVLQHLDRREDALRQMIVATRPGGWVVVEDADFVTFEGPDTPEPFATVARTMNEAYAAVSGHDRYLGRRLLGLLQGAGLDEVECDGRVFTMRGGQTSAEWYVRGIDRAGPSLAAAGLLDEEMLASALAQARQPGFTALSPIAMAAWGTVPS